VLDADRLGHRDLDVVDVGVVPDGLEDRIREPEREDVLDGLRCTTSASWRADSKSWPNGFSMTTRAKPGGLLSRVAPIACTITGKKLAGVDR
jgi:hypothetical protein